jgi:formylglycine-generating enzyme required for sulfatase activity
MTDDIERSYRALDLQPGASLEDVKASWRMLVKVWHPDRFPSDPKLRLKAEERLKLINTAYELLRDHLTATSAGSTTAEKPRPQGSRPPPQPRADEPRTPPPPRPPPPPRQSQPDRERRPAEAEASAAKGSSGTQFVWLTVGATLLAVLLIAGIHWSTEPDTHEEFVGFMDPAAPAPAPSDSGAASGDDRTLDLGGGVTLVLKAIPAGSFLMGSPESESGRDNDEGPQTDVTISRPFWLGQTEVTQAQWQAIMDDNPSNFEGADWPVETVSWEEAIKFCEKLTERERNAGRLPSGHAYTLPTEAQWEYACRAGTTLPNFEDTLGGRTHPAGLTWENPWGLRGMRGNVWEWCLDWYTDALPGGSTIDPRGAASGSFRVFRGGGWRDPTDPRSASRAGHSPNHRDAAVGFRLALSVIPDGHESINTTGASASSPADSPSATVVGGDLTLELPDGVTLVLKAIPAGSFLMGSPEDEPGRSANEGPQTHVTISRRFWLGWTAVTQAQWHAVMGTVPSNDNYADHPVKVTWEEAIEFCRKLTERERSAGRLPAGYVYTLPTEAEWEYACRAGTTTPYAGDLDEMGRYWEQDRESRSFTYPVGQKRANSWGLSDMHGNVGEWCLDWYADRLPGGSATDPVGAVSGDHRVARGGSEFSLAKEVRSASRHGAWPSWPWTGGFRLALSVRR